MRLATTIALVLATVLGAILGDAQTPAALAISNGGPGGCKDMEPQGYRSLNAIARRGRRLLWAFPPGSHTRVTCAAHVTIVFKSSPAPKPVQAWPRSTGTAKTQRCSQLG